MLIDLTSSTAENFEDWKDMLDIRASASRSAAGTSHTRSRTPASRSATRNSAKHTT